VPVFDRLPRTQSCACQTRCANPDAHAQTHPAVLPVSHTLSRSGHRAQPRLAFFTARPGECFRCVGFFVDAVAVGLLVEGPDTCWTRWRSVLSIPATWCQSCRNILAPSHVYVRHALPLDPHTWLLAPACAALLPASKQTLRLRLRHAAQLFFQCSGGLERLLSDKIPERNEQVAYLAKPFPYHAAFLALSEMLPAFGCAVHTDTACHDCVSSLVSLLSWTRSLHAPCGACCLMLHIRWRAIPHTHVLLTHVGWVCTGAESVMALRQRRDLMDCDAAGVVLLHERHDSCGACWLEHTEDVQENDYYDGDT
jgi:hypothetical protein